MRARTSGDHSTAVGALHPPRVRVGKVDEIDRSKITRARRRWILIRVAIAIALVAVSWFAPRPQRAPADIPGSSTVRGTIDAIASDQSYVQLRTQNGQVSSLRVGTPAAIREQTKQLHVGDQVTAAVTGNGDAAEIVRIHVERLKVDASTRFIVLAVIALGIWLLADVIVPGGARWLVLGEDNRYSNSKFQMALWFLLLITGYLATIVLRVRVGGAAYWGFVDIPSNLLWLSGFSVASFVGAKQIVASRIDTSPTVAARVKPPSPHGPRLRDLVTDDSGHRADFGDFQMLTITLVAVAIYALHLFGWLADLSLSASLQLPDVDTTLLGTFGVGQAAYLTKKLAGDSGKTAAPGPVSTAPPPKPSVLLPPNPGRE